MLFYSNLIYTQKYSFSASPYFQYLNIYFLQHVGAKKVFAKTAFQIWQVLSNFIIVSWSSESALDNDFCSIAPSAL